MIFHLLALTVLPAQAPDLRAGMVITESTTFRSVEVLAANPSDRGETAAITIRGDNLVVDFGGATLRGTPANVDPDKRTGTAIRVEGQNVTVKNVRVHGYRIGLIAKDAHGLRVLDSNFDHNYKPRLRSTLEGEDVGDWMSFHRNDEDEWLRFGAGIYLRNSDRAEIKNVTIRYGNCGLMITETDNALIWNNDFSFLSAVGVGLFRSSDNRIMHNNIDWCVRGHSFGVYNRGQDSTGILIHEQSHRNVFAYNSVTHGGDGYFLWAGQTSMDTGEGGCNDNLLYGNDWSHAPTNGIEATFSRSQFINNLIMECWHGIWGGYSFDTHIVGNVFAHNAEAIAIEHGQNNIVRDNVFLNDLYALAIWGNETEGDWPYRRNRDTRSRVYTVRDNIFRGITGGVLNLRNTRDLLFADNRVYDSNRVFDTQINRVSVRGVMPAEPETLPNMVVYGNSINAVEAALPDWVRQWGNVHDRRLAQPPPATMNLGGNELVDGNWDRAVYRERFREAVELWNPWPTADENKTKIRREIETWAPKPLEGGKDPFLGLNVDRGRRFVLIDQWGPVDFRRTPTLFLRTVQGMRYAPGFTPDPEVTMFETFGPEGTWRVRQLQGVLHISAREGKVGEMMSVRFDPKAAEHRIDMEFVGEESMDYRGVVTPAGRPVAFGWNRFRLPIDWTVRFFAWDPETSDPRTQEAAFRRILAGDPLMVERRSELNYVWGGAFAPNMPADHFATVAEATLDIEPGEYTIEVTSDDGVRVYVNNRRVIDEWRYQGATTFTARVQLRRGDRIRVEHFEITGAATLKVRFLKD